MKRATHEATITPATFTVLCTDAGHVWQTTGTIERSVVKHGPHRPRVRERQTLDRPFCPECGAQYHTMARAEG